MRALMSPVLRLWILTLTLVSGTTAIVPPASRAQSGTAEAYFVFSVSTHPETFVFKLTNPARIEQARDIIRTGANKIVSGTIIKQPVYYNSPWSFHFDPKTITFPDIAVEVCDASIRYIEDHLDTAYPSWCPWATRLLREIAPPPKPGPGNLNPTVSMTHPYANDTFATVSPSGITLVANADDPDGTITKVEFFNGGMRMGQVSGTPYMFGWDNPAAGSYSVSAIATDDQGAVRSSNSIRFTVTQPTNSNPIDDQVFFVTEHYRDFLSREPDASGLNYWRNEITRCGTDQACTNSRRIAVSAAFFVESEFQETGGFVYRSYKSSFGEVPAYAQFMSDRVKVVAAADLDAGKEVFSEGWVLRPEFLTKYPASLTGPQFVDALIQTVLQGSGVDLSGRRQALIDDYSVSGSRARIVRMIADDAALKQAEYNAAFVLMQYFGYLRRDPDFTGYDFWLGVLDRTPNNFQGMVCAFLTSGEYQARFSPVRTRNDSLCNSLSP